MGRRSLDSCTLHRRSLDPGYWAYGDSGYFWNAGYWGPAVGYYGGINYGFGYFGTGFYGGYWNGGHFFYNREYNHFGNGGGFRNVYDQRVSGFDGHPGGTSFARSVGNGLREGTLNGGINRGTVDAGNFGATNRSGFGQNGNQNFGRVAQVNEPDRTSNGSNMRGIYDGNKIAANNYGTDGVASQQQTYNQARPTNNFTGGFGGSANTRPSAPANNYRSGEGNSAVSQRSHAAPAVAHINSGGGGSFHGFGGGGSHGGRR